MINGTSILVTGGTGSFGKAFVREVLTNHYPFRVAVYSRDEDKQRLMAEEFRDIDQRKVLRFLIGDVRDRKRLSLACHGIDTIVSAAALKQVPALEYEPMEAVATNVTGAATNVIWAALANNVARVVYLSTDKAVAPVNNYGKSKAMGEGLIVAANAYTTETRFAAVRYGNVAGSRGSVIPVWRAMAAKGKSLSMTDAASTRFWMTLPQAVDFVVQAIDVMRGGEIFVPHLPSFRVWDLANVMGTPSTPTGLRPGEKLHETLITEDEARWTYVSDDGAYFVIARQPDDLIRDSRPEHGQPVGPGFRFASDVNTQWLNHMDLQRALAAV